MSEAAEYLLDLPARQVFGTEVEFIHRSTKRKRLGIIRDIGPDGILVRMRERRFLFVPFRSVVRISKPSQP
jgi:hypothetical protein